MEDLVNLKLQTRDEKHAGSRSTQGKECLCAGHHGGPGAPATVHVWGCQIACYCCFSTQIDRHTDGHTHTHHLSV